LNPEYASQIRYAVTQVRLDFLLWHRVYKKARAVKFVDIKNCKIIMYHIAGSCLANIGTEVSANKWPYQMIQLQVSEIGGGVQGRISISRRILVSI